MANKNFSSRDNETQGELFPNQAPVVKHTTHSEYASDDTLKKRLDAAQPLAARMRPRTLEEFIGQGHILAPGLLLRRAIEADRIQSLILYGPPGTGKTSLATLIATRTQTYFERLSGVESNASDIRRVLLSAMNRLSNTGRPTLLFIDEIHRFNKPQQDLLLPDVESG
ncbi:MAG: AAA family ATPase, partial [Treponema sp.]|nr:AAA family ATPase [Treponema sp.]